MQESSEDHQHYHGVDSVERHISVEEALSKLLKNIKPVKSELIKSSEGFNRVLFRDISSPIDVPTRARSTRDGYALRISESNGSGNKRFKLVGDVRIGTSPKIRLSAREAVRIATGSYIPPDANSVVMVEYVQENDGEIVLQREPRIGENILRKGEDIARNSLVLKRGTRLRSHHVALLAQIGIRRIQVFQKPLVSVLSTGDELFDAFKGKASETQIPDINRPFIRSMLEALNSRSLDLGIARDNFETIREKIERGLKSSDALLLSAGSSVGERDYALKAAKSIPGVNILVHGVAMRPSSPTGLAVYNGKPFILLPGFPTSAFMSFFVFARTAIQKISGEETDGGLEPLIKVKMIDSYEGKKDIKHFLRVRVSKSGGNYVAIITKPTDAYYSSWLGKANGIAVLDEKRTTIQPGDQVDVFLIGSVERTDNG
jgi:molybdopterin molybdotransferase